MPLETGSVYPPPSRDIQKFASRRSVVHSTKGIVACTQPLAAKCGIDILNAGGNAADAAVAVAAGMNMTEPCSTGIGGDMFCLFYDAEKRQVRSVNGSGRSGAKYTLAAVRQALGLEAGGRAGEIPQESALSVTVPGAAAGWVDTVERFGSGRLSMAQILAPAIELGKNGVPVSEIASISWQLSEKRLRAASKNFREMLKADPAAPDGCRAPKPGEIMKLPNLARTFEELAAHGKKGFYTGRVAEELVRVVRDSGGLLELDDLRHHLEESDERLARAIAREAGAAPPSDADRPDEPIKLRFGAVDVWEHPPNGQGIVALMALGIIQELERAGRIPRFGPADHNSAEYLHVVIEALRIAFADAAWYVTDPHAVRVPVDRLLSPEYLARRAELFSPDRAATDLRHGDVDSGGDASFASPAFTSSDTVYFAVSDSHGNAASFINSNYSGFGTAIIPEGCGFTLQNRGSNFSLDAGHPNVLAPRKRPYHTIIPGLVTNAGDGSLHSVFGVMGGFMQPQGHVQTLLGQLVFGLSPQQALDAPRVCVGPGTPGESGIEAEDTVSLEEGIPRETADRLAAMGHGTTVPGVPGGEPRKEVKILTGIARSLFGRGQIIRYTLDPVDKTGVWSAGSDPRGDGAAYPQ